MAKKVDLVYKICKLFYLRSNQKYKANLTLDSDNNTLTVREVPAALAARLVETVTRAPRDPRPGLRSRATGCTARAIQNEIGPSVNDK